ncbi:MULTISPECIES: DMT family transporter [unclassified Oleiphilus]|nr:MULTISPECIES: DMT family transporter [unclassified Oleiphilus]KZY61780.1 hypothetical protein A3738_03005 [Oleiphilus sp. HI0066]KZY73076.1 hypothetical protein A3739_02790 [Oleiphilus sp. HI0067]
MFRTISLTSIALLAFAGNSVLCRMAFTPASSTDIDPASFTAVRLISAVIVLFLILSFSSNKRERKAEGNGLAGAMLFVYAAAFSFAYTLLDTGTGALILFGSVQLSMILIAYFRGERLSGSEISGFLIAFAGLIYLILPGAGAPSLLGFILMSISGAAWGVYSLPGKNSTDTLSDTFFNFLRTLPLVAVLLINGVIFGSLQLNAEGLLLAALSGGIASGLGYTIWFLAAKRLNTSQSAAVQLLVPVIAAFFGLSLLDEAITQRLVLSSLLILGGVILVVITRGLVASR